MATHWHITKVLQNFLRKFQLNAIVDIRAVVTTGHMPHSELEQRRCGQNMNWLKTIECYSWHLCGRNDWSYASFWTRTKKIYTKHELIELPYRKLRFWHIWTTLTSQIQINIFTHDQISTKLILNSTKSSTIPIIIQA